MRGKRGEEGGEGVKDEAEGVRDEGKERWGRRQVPRK